jgi:SsrA-binding protein
MTSGTKLLIKNKKALFNYELLESYIAGIVLKGYEVKALREGKASFEGSYVTLDNKKLVVKNIKIGRYSKQSTNSHPEDASRNRDLLLNKTEIEQFRKSLDQKGLTAVPLAFVLQNGKIKLEIGVVRGRKEFEKKQVAKEKQIKRDLERQLREYKN